MWSSLNDDFPTWKGGWTSLALELFRGLYSPTNETPRRLNHTNQPGVEQDYLSYLPSIGTHSSSQLPPFRLQRQKPFPYTGQ